MEIKNAKIEGTTLGFEGHGILSIMLTLDYGGSCQGFGGHNLTENCSEWVTKILKVVGVESWEDLKGKHVRVERADGWNGRITGIGNFLEDKWFRP